jgi:hypothetical protein
MNRAEELALAWALADAATTLLRPDARTWLCAKIGAGEQESAIMDLLAVCARSRAELPPELAASVQTWIRGYAGSDTEPILRRLVDAIQVAVRTHHRSATLPRYPAAASSQHGPAARIDRTRGIHRLAGT